MHQSMGLIEIKGLANAIIVADTMAKVANICIHDVERAKGFGWTTIKVEGDVAAVKASIEAGEQIARVNDCLLSSKVIARPADHVRDLFLPDEPEQKQADKGCLNEQKTEQSDLQYVKLTNQAKPLLPEKQKPNSIAIESNSAEVNSEEQADERLATCNICHDPNCARKKGEPRKHCLHYKDKQ